MSDKTLLCASEKSVEVYSLDDPAHPTLIGTAGPDLGSVRARMILDGNRLFHFGNRHGDRKQPGFLAAFDMTQPRRPTLIGLTNYPYGPSDGCIVKDRLLLVHEMRSEKDDRRYTCWLAAFNLAAGWPPQLLGEVPCANGIWWCLPVGEQEILAGDYRAMSRLRIPELGLPEFLPDKIDVGSRSAVLSRRAEGEFLLLDGSVLMRHDGSWTVLGWLPKACQGDGRAYRASSQGPYVAIPGDDRIWLYVWEQ